MSLMLSVGTWVVLCIIGNLSGGGEVRWSNYITTLHFTFSGTADLHLPFSEHPNQSTALDGVITPVCEVVTVYV